MSPVKHLLQILDPYLVKWRNQRVPFVWRLGISKKDFATALNILEKDLSQKNNFKNYITSKELADTLLLMAAEWYKRKYEGEAALPEWIKNIEFEKVWKNSSVERIDRWIYKFDNGNYSWQYSAFVLGGLACAWYNKYIIETLLRIFNEDENKYDEINTDSLDNNAAIALKLSIENKGSIFSFFQELKNPSSELRKIYNNDFQSEVNEFTSLIDSNIKDLEKRKVYIEWRISADELELFKTLKLRIKPERIDNGDGRGTETVSFVSVERLREWGFENIKDIAEIKLFIRFLLNNKKAGEDIPVAVLRSKGKTSAGYQIVENSENPLPIIPSNYDSWCLVAENHNQRKIISDLYEVLPFEPIYKVANVENEWSTVYRHNKAAVIFNHQKCEIIDPIGHTVSSKTLVEGNRQGGSIYWADIPVRVKVKYVDRFGDYHTKEIENPLANSTVVIEQKPFNDLFIYTDSNKIKVIETDSETGEEIVSYLPLVYGLDNIYLHASEDKKNNKEIRDVVFEFYQNGEKIDTKEDLKEGILNLILKGEGHKAQTTVWYIPTKSGWNCPALRNLEKKDVDWLDNNYEKLDILSGDEEITVTYVRHGRKSEKAFFKILKPLNLKEVFLNGNRVYSSEKYIPIDIGLLNLEDIVINIFNEDGYIHWIGKEHFDELKSLIINKPSNILLENNNIRVHNWLYNLDRNPLKETTIDGNVIQQDKERSLWRVPNITNRDYEEFNPFSDNSGSSSDLSPYEILEKMIELNLYAMCFDSLMNASKDETIKLFEKLRNNRGKDFLLQNIKTIKRILWEKDMDLSDINIEI